jgi:hypothetical protein
MLVVIRFLPIPLHILAHDSCSWDAVRHELRDTIKVSLIGAATGPSSHAGPPRTRPLNQPNELLTGTAERA